MKRLITYILLFACFVPILAQVEFDDLEKKDIVRNKIRSKTQWDYKYVDGVPVEEGFKSSYRKYDYMGNVIIVINFKFDGSVSSTEQYSYNNKGDRTEYIRYKGNQEELQYKENTEYDDKGNKLRVYGKTNKSSFNNVYTYNDEDKVAEIVYNVGDFIDEKRVFEYDGNTSTISVMDAKDNLKYTLVTSYNDKGQVTEETRYELDEAVSDKASYQYDSKGNVLKEEKYKHGQFRYRVKYTYDAAGHVLKVVQEEPSGISYEKSLCTYDAQGHLIEEKWRKNATSDFSKKDYSYNEEGLCIKMDAYFASYDLKVLSKFAYKTTDD
ncbi:MAG: hypothetical protein JXB49_12030 [Bacteroidales bacterium]|nr:hypothetical protein [Bacteroidales bacterium]